jgi:hypothetical protein
MNLITIGHCRFPLYIPQKIGNLDTWDVTFGPVTRALHPGLPPISIDMIPDIPKAFVAGIVDFNSQSIFDILSLDKIGPGSTISLTVFDPKAEQHFSQ